MAFTPGKGAVFSLDDAGGTLRTLTSYVDDVSGLPASQQLEDVTTFGNSGTRWIPTIQDAKFTVKGNFDSTATTGPYAVINSLRTATATASFEYGPEGSTTGKVKLSGECWLTDFTVDASVKGKVPFSASFQVDGVVTSGVY